MGQRRLAGAVVVVVMRVLVGVSLRTMLVVRGASVTEPFY